MENQHLQQGIKALRSGDRREARRILGALVQLEPDNAPAWWYLSAALDDRQQQMECLRQVVRLRPNHEKAARLLAQIDQGIARPTPVLGIDRPVLDLELQGDAWKTPVDPTHLSELWGLDFEEKEEQDASGFPVWLFGGGLLVGALLGLAVIVLIGSYRALDRTESAPTLPPIALTFDVPECVSLQGEGVQVMMVNESPTTIRLLRGEVDAETYQVTLTRNSEYPILLEPGIPVRFKAEPELDGYLPAGVVLDIPDGNRCRVVVR